MRRSRFVVNRLGGEDLSHFPSPGRNQPEITLTMQEVTFEEALDQIVAKDPRYHRDAYLFVREALDFTQKIVGKESTAKIRHVTGQELLDGIRQFALSQFGPMAATVFSEWGIHNCTDFGNIVFNLVETRVLAKTDKDSEEDFKGGYCFEDAFRKPFLPTNKLISETRGTSVSVKPANDQ